MIKNLFVLVCGAFLFFSCSSNNDALFNTEWKLASIKSAAGENVTVPTDKVPNLTIEKEGGAAFGYAGCNQFRGMAKVEKSTIKFDGVAMTRMMCIDNTVENAFTEMLNTVDKFKIKGEELIMKKGSTEIAVFKK